MRTSALELVLALALLGCTEKQPTRCDSDAADELVARLEAADPHERARTRLGRSHAPGCCAIGPRRASIGEREFEGLLVGYTRFATLGEPDPFVYAAQTVFGPAARRRDH